MPLPLCLSLRLSLPPSLSLEQHTQLQAGAIGGRLKILSNPSIQFWPPSSSYRLSRVSGGSTVDQLKPLQSRGIRCLAASRMVERYFQNDMMVGPELDGDDVTRTILKAAAAALKVGRPMLLQEAAGLPPDFSMDQSSSYVLLRRCWQEVKACALQHRDVSGGGIYIGLGGVGLTYLRMAQRAARGYK